MNLLAVAHNYRQQGKQILLFKPDLDMRFGKEHIRSRAGLEMVADILIGPDTDLLSLNYEGVHCLLVDEVQFVSSAHIDQLREITLSKNIPVICYGLRTDFKTKLFEGALRLLELADAIEEVKATCHFCNRKSIFNLRHVDGVASVDGPVVQLGAEERYYPTCYGCYSGQIKKRMELLQAAH